MSSNLFMKENKNIKTPGRFQEMNTEQINRQQTDHQMTLVKKSSNIYIGTTIFLMLAIIVIGMVFG